MSTAAASPSNVKRLLAAADSADFPVSLITEARRQIAAEMAKRGFSHTGLEGTIGILAREPAKHVGGGAVHKAARAYAALRQLEDGTADAKAAIVAVLEVISLPASTRQQTSDSGDAWYPKAKKIYWDFCETHGREPTAREVYLKLKKKGYSPHGSFEVFEPQYSGWRKRFGFDMVR